MEATDIRGKVEAAWHNRYEANKDFYGKKSSVKYRKAQCEFFVGAMAAINALEPNQEDANLLSKAIPPWWVIAVMSGRDIVEGK